MQRFHTDATLFKNNQYVPTCVWFTSISLCFRNITIVQELLRFHHRIFRFYFKRSELLIVLNPSENHLTFVNLPMPTLAVRILLEDNNVVLPKFHFMFSGRYSCRIQDFEKCLNTSLFPSGPSFAINWKFGISRILRYVKRICFEDVPAFPFILVAFLHNKIYGRTKFGRHFGSSKKVQNILEYGPSLN